MIRSHNPEIPIVQRLGVNHWRIRFAGGAAFEADDRSFTAFVRTLSQLTKARLFAQLSEDFSHHRKPNRSIPHAEKA
jgi:hypothetical protein